MPQRDPRTSLEIDQVAELNRKERRKVELAALALLKRARRRALVAPNIVAAEQGFALEVEAAIRESRKLARLAGLSRLRAEAAAIGFELANVGDTLAETAHDARRAAFVARRHVERWSRTAREALGRNLELRSALIIANRKSAAGAATIGITEPSDAFTGARTRAVQDDRKAAARLLRVWDAQDDKRTCPVCNKADGMIVGVRESFPDGEPGSVHPRCRCGWTLLAGAFDADGVRYVPSNLKSV